MDGELTPASVDAGAGAWAARLRSRGVGAGDRVGLLAPNGATYLEILEAASRLGAAVVLLNPRLRAEDLQFQLDDSGTCATLADPSLADLVDDPWLLDELAGQPIDAPVHREHTLDSERPFILLYTSGTTGRPKGCVLSVRAWNASIANTVTVLDLKPGDRYLARAPFFHVAGLSVVTATLAIGGTVVPAPAKALSAADQWAYIERERITVASFTAPLAEVAATAPRTTPLRLTFGQGGRWGADVHAEMAARASMVAVVGSYGSTEAGNFATRATGADERQRPGTIGRALPRFEAMVADEDDRPVAVGVAGQLLLRGPSMLSGYWNLPEATAATMAGGWLHTGDVVRSDEDGFLFLLDRLKDMVKPGGENVYCVEVERVLRAHPSVAQCAVIGVPDERWGEGVKAVVVGDVTPEALDAWCLDRLASYKRPRWYELVDDIPLTAGNKVDKRRLRDEHDPARSIRLAERDRVS